MDWLAIIRAIAPKGKPAIVQAAANAMPGIVAEFSLINPLRQAHFLSQLAHESDGFKTTVEYWGPTSAQNRYEGRADLGNTQPGDGKRYMGRGLIQLTGRANYASAGRALGLDLVSRPELAGQFPHAIRIAGWYWQTRKLNALADADNVETVTKKINGGHNGLEDRKRYLARAKEAIERQGDAVPPPVAKPKDMSTSKTGNASIIAGAGGVVATGKAIVDVASEAKNAATDATGLLMSVGPWVLLAVVIIAAAAFIWWDRRKKMQEFGI
jgi:putative chitinase